MTFYITRPIFLLTVKYTLHFQYNPELILLIACWLHEALQYIAAVGKCLEDVLSQSSPSLNKIMLCYALWTGLVQCR